MAGYYFVALLAVFLTATSQVLLKLASRRTGIKAWQLYLNRYTVTAYAILVGVTLLNLYAYREIPLKSAVILLPLTLLLVGGFSFWFLHERLTSKQVGGAILILVGVVVFNL